MRWHHPQGLRWHPPQQLGRVSSARSLSCVRLRLLPQSPPPSSVDTYTILMQHRGNTTPTPASSASGYHPKPTTLTALQACQGSPECQLFSQFLHDLQCFENPSVGRDFVRSRAADTSLCGGGRQCRAAMGNWISKTEPPPPVVLVPPLLERPHFATRSRMTESSYDLMFSKLARARLFNMYFDESRNILAQFVLQPADDPRVDVTGRVLAPTHGDALDSFDGEAVFRWQREVLDPNNFADLTISSVGSPIKIRACTFDSTRGLGAWTLLPLNPTNMGKVGDNIVLGARYATSQFTMGTSVSPLQWAGAPTSQWIPTCAWACGRVGPITTGVQFKSLGKKSFENGSWSYAIDYGVGGKSPLEPSFNFCVELTDNSKLIASYYHHLVVQRRVKNPLEIKEVVAITNYVDLGFEFEHMLKADVTDSGKASLASVPPKMQLAGSWQANKNVQVKAKLGSRNSGLTVILKSWWQPSVTLSLAAVRDHKVGLTDLGFGVRVENFGDVSYERADPNYVMLTPTKQHLAEGLLKETGKRPMLQTDDVKSLSSQTLPADLRPPTDNLM